MKINELDEARLIDLEMKFAHQEFELNSLKEALFEQDKIVAQLAVTVKLLKDKLDATLTAQNDIGPGDAKPPHY